MPIFKHGMTVSRRARLRRLDIVCGYMRLQARRSYHFNAVAPIFFGEVQSIIGTLYGAFNVSDPLATRHSQANGLMNAVLSGFHELVCQGKTSLLGYMQGAIQTRLW